jgi:hypothetical protein
VSSSVQEALSGSPYPVLSHLLSLAGIRSRPFSSQPWFFHLLPAPLAPGRNFGTSCPYQLRFLQGLRTLGDWRRRRPSGVRRNAKPGGGPLLVWNLVPLYVSSVFVRLHPNLSYSELSSQQVVGGCGGTNAPHELGPARRDNHVPRATLAAVGTISSTTQGTCITTLAAAHTR